MKEVSFLTFISDAIDHLKNTYNEKKSNLCRSHITPNPIREYSSFHIGPR